MTMMPHVVRLAILAAADMIVRLALHFEPRDALFGNASELFLDALVLYWVYCVGVRLLNRVAAGGSADIDELSLHSARTNAVNIAAATACAAVVLALAAYIGARLRVASVGGPSLPIVALLIGVVDARVVADVVMERLVGDPTPSST
jgi:hypothetical protein